LRKAKADCINRILDANANRLKEGWRVCEEVSRFILNDRLLSAGFKRMRHKTDILLKELLSCAFLESRDSLKDVGLKCKQPSEFARKNWQDIFFANMQRVKESLRVLEEFSKLKSGPVSLQFKRIRYGAYELEKRTVKKILSLRDIRHRGAEK
jgi:thiamine-phosphate pyrophosphorylase